MKNWIARGALLGATALASWSYGGGDGEERTHGRTRYRIVSLSSLGGTNSRANSINDLGLMAGYTTRPGDPRREATLWFFGARAELGTLGGPSSSVVWPVKNDRGIVAGISYTDKADPYEEDWSCSAFLPGAEPAGQHLQCLGFVWEWGTMRPLPTLGGTHGFATGANNRRQIVGWAENDVEGGDCDRPQVLQFRPVLWGPGTEQVTELPLIDGDSSGSATAINDRGQIVGISGECDQAVGRHSAKHAVLWEHGRVRDIGDLGRRSWNTPMAINERGDVVGFAAVNDDDPDNPINHAFRWTRHAGIEDLAMLTGDDNSQANSINEHGEIVGNSCLGAVCRAFLFKNGEMHDLKGLLETSFPHALENAQDINDLGYIAGRAIDRTTTPQQRWAFVAIPTRTRD